MPKIHGGVRVSSFISPSDASDTYGTHDSIYGIGGWREVATTAERDEVSAYRHREGMVVYVSEDQVSYQLTAENTWVPLVTTPGVSDVTGLTAALAGKEDSIAAGTSAQYSSPFA